MANSASDNLASADEAAPAVGAQVLQSIVQLGDGSLSDTNRGNTKDTINGDITDVWTGAAARSEVLYERNQGRSKLLLVRGLNVSYGSVQVLFNVDVEIEEGSCVALLGTNGAGKSTLLKAISGTV